MLGKPKLVIVAGLPGSGKTYYFDSLVEKGKIARDLIFDDFHAYARNNSETIEASRRFTKLISDLRTGKDCIVSDIEFCRWHRRDNLIKVVKTNVPGTVIEIRYFENEPELCKRNVARRARDSTEKEISKIDELSKPYDIPEDTVVLKIYEEPDAPRRSEKKSRRPHRTWQE